MMRIALFLATNLAVILVASVTLNLLGVEHYLSGTGLNLTSLLIFCAVFGFAGSIISLLLSKMMAKMSTRTQLIEQPRTEQERWLLDTVAELSQKAGIKMPDVGVFPAQQANAFATGWNKNDALVAVSAGLMQRFRPEEIRAVLAHEIGHVANGDMVTLALIQGVVNTFVMFFARIAGYAVDSFLRRGEQSGGVGIGFYITTFVFEIIFGIIASTIVAWFSRRREYRADEAGAQLASPHAMIGALQRLKAEYGMPDQLEGQLTAFGISSHMKQGFMALFASHPPLDDRIAHLKQIGR
ncbi:protease HtpX [Marinobacterium iners]|jgi:heat shock protein HtpX|uniref:Protease HtpX n=1 Tax=Marinobacterium iners DSM 11526 TaxID=1122198 RepID=A0A1H4EBW9_9GAMM|nr:protease HtpX [Marinobacterium iners]SEA82541.1 Heat shock protein. Metallo peptidase. MEROPS family M48B [Marinobacterium iners DSM 11526]